MAKTIKNEADLDFKLRTVLSGRGFSCKWETKKTTNEYIQSVLNYCSKRNTNERGEPDLIYVNVKKRLLILIENKDSVGDHQSKTGGNPVKYAVDGIKHYLSFFTATKLKKGIVSTNKYLQEWNIVGIAFSGDMHNEYNHKISTFIIQNDIIKDVQIGEIRDENDYLSIFNNIDIEKLTEEISKSSSSINKLLRNIESQKRPVLLSALIISLYDKGIDNNFKKTYNTFSSDEIVYYVPDVVKRVLKNENIPEDKIINLMVELSFLKTIDTTTKNILKDILIELDNKILPLFDSKANYDIIGKFYEEFLRYAGVTNVKKGIVLTPNHITSLFTELIDIKFDDVFFDPCCGTGAFLIAAMKKLSEEIKHSDLPDKTKRIENLKRNQLVGFELSPMMYSLAVSNMLLRGDGKSRIFHYDFFSKEADLELNNLLKEGIKPTIGFINPPYGGKDTKDYPTKKEIQFIEKLLDKCSRYVVVIAPQSTYFNDEDIRNRILTKHTLKYVINTPKDLFMPNAAVNTAISVFETNIPHQDKEVVMFDLIDDGLVLSKNKGRRDVYNKWGTIKGGLLQKIKKPNEFIDNITLVKVPVKPNDEWLIQAHAKVDYSRLKDNDFINFTRDTVIFNIKKDLNLINKEVKEGELLDILIDYPMFNKQSVSENRLELKTEEWQEFLLCKERDRSSLFEIEKGERLTKADRIDGDTPLITASMYNNGITSLIQYEAFSESKKIFNNKLTVDMFCNVFYHQYEYFSDDNVHTLFFKNKEYKHLYDNIYVNLFLETVISHLKSKFGFGRQVRIKRLEGEYIKLPVTPQGEPAWQFMEDYIKGLPYSANL